MSAVDINCDMGESFGRWTLGADAEIMPHISSANVACGGHAGDPNVMAATVRLAAQHGVAVGAHPGYPDLAGFGRRHIPMRVDEIRNMVLAQIGSLAAIARAEGREISHVKPHGALYNEAMRGPSLAAAVVAAVRGFSKMVPVYCLPGSEVERAAAEAGIPAVSEGFADRAYEPNGSLVDRSRPGAVLQNDQAAADQALGLARGEVIAVDGTLLRLRVGTICIHGDNPGAVEIVRAVREKLERAGFTISPPAR
ncbi:MAG TPA: 5-oxoprolinase subunit PxpA [Chloroflexia bacterium]|nr:5-oxoprolinase subunit PxpA [Chloroflexia bacterium]